MIENDRLFAKSLASFNYLLKFLFMETSNYLTDAFVIGEFIQEEIKKRFADRTNNVTIVTNKIFLS